LDGSNELPVALAFLLKQFAPQAALTTCFIVVKSGVSKERRTQGSAQQGGQSRRCEAPLAVTGQLQPPLQRESAAAEYASRVFGGHEKAQEWTGVSGLKATEFN
jgi:hypothetical protein